MPQRTVNICVVGVGPRGLSVLERLSGNVLGILPPDTEVRVHLIDPHLHSGSRVWNTAQSTNLLMNTVASQVTMFADDSVECEGPIQRGPSLYEWALFIALLHPFEDMDAALVREAEKLGPDSYPTRAFYGHYLAWVLEHVTKTAPANVTIVRHAREAMDLRDEPDGRQCLTLDDGTTLRRLDSVVLTLGHTPAALSPKERGHADFARARGLVYIPPASPADVDLSLLRPGRPVILQGLGLTFFDYMALLTTGRGGRFVRAEQGRLEYLPSGREPRLIAGSRRGIPHQARGENQKGADGRHEPLFFTDSVVERLRQTAESGTPVDFEADVWPLVDREVRAVYYTTLITERLCRCDADLFLRHYVAYSTRIRDIPAPRTPDPFTYVETQAERALLERFGIGPGELWDWAKIARPYATTSFPHQDAYARWLVAYLRRDVAEAKRGNVRGPVKAALDVLRDLRNEIRLVVDHGRLSGDSYRDDLQRWYTPLNAFLSIGPPTSRIEEMAALIESGVLQPVGPGLEIEHGTGFVARARTVPGSVFHADALIEARLPEPDVRSTTSPLLSALLARGECSLHRIPIRGGGFYETGGLAVTQRPYRLLDGQRRPHPRRFAFGVPTEAVHWVTAAGIRPGVNSVILGDSDAVARASLRVSLRPGDRSEHRRVHS